MYKCGICERQVERLHAVTERGIEPEQMTRYGSGTGSRVRCDLVLYFCASCALQMRQLGDDAFRCTELRVDIGEDELVWTSTQSQDSNESIGIEATPELCDVECGLCFQRVDQLTATDHGDFATTLTSEHSYYVAYGVHAELTFYVCADCARKLQNDPAKSVSINWINVHVTWDSVSAVKAKSRSGAFVAIAEQAAETYAKSLLNRCWLCDRQVYRLETFPAGDLKIAINDRQARRVQSEVKILACHSCADQIQRLNEGVLGELESEVSDQMVMIVDDLTGIVRRSRAAREAAEEELRTKMARKERRRICGACRKVAGTLRELRNETVASICKPRSQSGTSVIGHVSSWVCGPCSEIMTGWESVLHSELRLDFDVPELDDVEGLDWTTDSEDESDEFEPPPEFEQKVWVRDGSQYLVDLTQLGGPQELRVLRSVAAFHGYKPFGDSKTAEIWSERMVGQELKLPVRNSPYYGEEFRQFVCGVTGVSTSRTSVALRQLFESFEAALASADLERSHARSRNPNNRRLLGAASVCEVSDEIEAGQTCRICIRKVNQLYPYYAGIVRGEILPRGTEPTNRPRFPSGSGVRAEATVFACASCADELSSATDRELTIEGPFMTLEREVWKRVAINSKASEPDQSDLRLTAAPRIMERQVCGACQSETFELVAVSRHTEDASYVECLCPSGHEADCIDAEVAIWVCRGCADAIVNGFLYFRAEVRLAIPVVSPDGRTRDVQHGMHYWTSPPPAYELRVLRAAAALSGFLPRLTRRGDYLMDEAGFEHWASEDGLTETRIPFHRHPRYARSLDRFAFDLWPEPIVQLDSRPPSRVGRRLIDAVNFAAQSAEKSGL